MKTFLDSITTSLQQRLSNPLLGSFFLSWAVINIKTIISVITLSGQERIEYLNTLKLDYYTDAIYPFIGALSYLFILPLIQRWLDNTKYHLIDKKRKKDKNQQLRMDSFESKKLNRSLSTSTLEYWSKVREVEVEERRELAKANLSNWDQEKKSLEAQLSSLKSKESAFMNLNDTFVTLKENNEKVSNLKINADYDTRLAEMKEHSIQVNRLISHIETYMSSITEDERDFIINNLLIDTKQPLGRLNHRDIATLLKNIATDTTASIVAENETSSFYETQKRINELCVANDETLTRTPYYTIHATES